MPSTPRPIASRTRQRRHRGQHEVGARADAVERERLPGVGVAGLDVEQRGHVEQARDADRRVHGEARQLAAGAERPGLEQVVHQPARHLEVVEQPRELRRAVSGQIVAHPVAAGLTSQRSRTSWLKENMRSLKACQGS